MKTTTFIICLIFNLMFINGQQFNNDTIRFKNYIGVIYDEKYAPFASRNIFPKNRFKPSQENIYTVEKELQIQYSKAERIYFALSFENTKIARDDYTKKEYRNLKRYYKKSNIDRIVKKMQDQFAKQHCDYDREYYGYIG